MRNLLLFCCIICVAYAASWWSRSSGSQPVPPISPPRALSVWSPRRLWDRTQSAFDSAVDPLLFDEKEKQIGGMTVLSPGRVIDGHGDVMWIIINHNAFKRIANYHLQGRRTAFSLFIHGRQITIPTHAASFDGSVYYSWVGQGTQGADQGILISVDI
jgi:hypothetical protein